MKTKSVISLVAAAIPFAYMASGYAATATDTFKVTANVASVCSISAGDVTFGTVDPSSSLTTASSIVRAQCTAGEDYTIALSAGNSGDASGRYMLNGTNPGTASMTYNLYTDDIHASVWGDGVNGTFLHTGTGTGVTQEYTIFGLVDDNQTSLSPGSFYDSITATLTYDDTV